MTTIEKQVTIREITADEGMVITDKKTERTRAKKVYLGKEAVFEDEFKEIPEDTPVPELKPSTAEQQAQQPETNEPTNEGNE